MERGGRPPACSSLGAAASSCGESSSSREGSFKRRHSEAASDLGSEEEGATSQTGATIEGGDRAARRSSNGSDVSALWSPSDMVQSPTSAALKRAKQRDALVGRLSAAAAGGNMHASTLLRRSSRGSIPMPIVPPSGFSKDGLTPPQQRVAGGEVAGGE